MASEYNEAARIEHRGVLVYVPTKFPWIVDSPKKRQKSENPKRGLKGLKFIFCESFKEGTLS